MWCNSFCHQKECMYAWNEDFIRICFGCCLSTTKASPYTQLGDAKRHLWLFPTALELIQMLCFHTSDSHQITAHQALRFRDSNLEWLWRPNILSNHFCIAALGCYINTSTVSLRSYAVRSASKWQVSFEIYINLFWSYINMVTGHNPESKSNALQKNMG